MRPAGTSVRAFGSTDLTLLFSKHSAPLGIVRNRRASIKIHRFFPLKRFIYRERSRDIQTARIHMKQRLATSLAIMACVSALICVVSLYAGAQQGEGQSSAPAYATAGKASKALPDGGPAPRLADGHPDFSGIWFVGSLGKEDALSVQSAASQGDQALRPFDPKVTPEEQPSFQRW